MKRIGILALCLLLLAGMVQAKSSAEWKKELQALQAEAEALGEQGAALQEELDQNRSETQTTIDRKYDIDRQIHQTEREIENMDQQIRYYGLLIAEKQADLETAEQEYADQNTLCKARLRAMEEQGTVSYWSILFKSRSFADLLDRIQMIREIAEADRHMLEQLQAAAEHVTAERNQLQAEQQAQLLLKNQLQQLTNQLEQQRQEADACLLELTAAFSALGEEYERLAEQEAEIQKQVMEAQVAYDKALSAEEASRLAQMNQNNAAGSGMAAGSGSAGFQCPVSGAFVTDPYGWRIHPVSGQRKFHTGVDFAVPMHTPIYAMASGTVSACGSNNAYGYYVTLSHGGGYGSFYGHMTHYVVASGDTVSQGQVIGYVGSTGISTGPHLHFEIYVNGGTVNPM